MCKNKELTSLPVVALAKSRGYYYLYSMKLNKKTVAIFGNNQIRRLWDADKELWYFSIIDVIKTLTNSSIPKRYWSDLKNKLKDEGSEVYDKIVQLKFMAKDGKYYLTD